MLECCFLVLECCFLLLECCFLLFESYFLLFVLLPRSGDLDIFVFDDGAEVGGLRNIVSTILVQ